MTNREMRDAIIWRQRRLDAKQARFDFEVGVYTPDEPGDRDASHGNTRLPYGLCRAAGIDTEGMTPREAWDALSGKTGIKASEAYKTLEKEGNAKKLAAKAEKAAKKKPKKVHDEPEVSGTEDFETPVVVKPEPTKKGITPAQFSEITKSMKYEYSTVGDFATALEREVLPRVKAGQTVSASGREYYCNGHGFQTEKGEERTIGFVAYRLAKFSKEDGYALSLKNGDSGAKLSAEKDSRKYKASSQFRKAMISVATVVEGEDDAKANQHILNILRELPVGAKITYDLYHESGKFWKTGFAEKVDDGLYYTDSGVRTDETVVTNNIFRTLKRGGLPKLEAINFTLPEILKTTSGYKGAEKKVAATKKSPSSMPHSNISTATKLMLHSTGETITVKTTREKPYSDVARKRARIARSQWRAMNKGTYSAEDARRVSEGMARLFAENEFCIDVPGSILTSLLKKGFRNQIQNFEDVEIEKKAGSYAHEDERRVASKAMFGTPLLSEASAYEIYGFLGNPWSYSGDYGSTYGDVCVVFKKDSIRDRTTYTLGDSLGPAVNRGAVAGTCGESPSAEGWYVTNPDPDVAKALESGAELGSVLSATKNPYVELQYHGELTMSDVQCIVFRDEAAYRKYVTKEIQAALDSLGIEVSVR